MVDGRQSLPGLISIVGVDGSGKTTLANCLADELAAQGIRPVLVWSRFRNYLSKPLLALTRLTGHNYYCTYEGIRFGYHDFERLAGYRELFALLQAIDVNIAAYARIHRRRAWAGVLICERGPWDTLVDVTADTGLMWLPESSLGRAYSLLVRRDATVFWVSRDGDKILKSRPELVHDPKLEMRNALYAQLSATHGWHIIDNNGTLDESREQIRTVLHMPGSTVTAAVRQEPGG